MPPFRKPTVRFGSVRTAVGFGSVGSGCGAGRSGSRLGQLSIIEDEFTPGTSRFFNPDICEHVPAGLADFFGIV